MRVPAALAVSLAGVVASAAPCPDRTWPSDSWPTRTIEKADAIAALESYAFTRTGADEERLGIRTDSVLVIHDGAIIYERYVAPWNADGKHLVWSVTKSITSALTGIAAAKAGLDVTKSLCEYVDSPRDEHCDVTVEHLLGMSSGIQWKEIYENESNQASSVLAMLYGVGNGDILSFVLGHERKHAPGKFHSYSSGESNVLMAVADGAMRAKGADQDWPWKELFEPLGMKRITIEQDQKGLYVGSSYAYTRPRDLARFGLLYLDDGCVAGTRILPESWVAQSLTPIPTPEHADPAEEYGWQWYLNTPNANAEGGRPYPSLPEDAYAARGHWGQSMIVVPSKKLIVVRLADDRDGSFDFDRFAGLALGLVD